MRESFSTNNYVWSKDIDQPEHTLKKTFGFGCHEGQYR
jgi:hypothetical protein